MNLTKVAMALGILIAPWTAWGVTDGYSLDDYQLKTSEDLLDICSLPASDPGHWEARGFCIGYFTGGIDLHVALGLPRISCAPGDVTRSDAIQVFIDFAKANPQYLSERPMDTVFRAVQAKWPCS
ncbi:MAG: Rap1a/Tai family immunity protein [Pseudomonadota bacterium]